MTPCPAFTLALLGWCLITPPSRPNGSFDEGAPLGLWDRQESYASSDECKNGRNRLLELEAASGTTQRDLAEMKQTILKSRCIASDDPLLQQK